MHKNVALDTMPDGTDFVSWERPAVFTRTLHVDAGHPDAGDANPGTAEAPFASIAAAARIVRPGERVLVHPGVYREGGCPVRGGADPEAMVHFEAAEPGQVVISASEVYDGPWLPSAGWGASRAAAENKSPALWMAALPRKWFDGYNPFATANMVQTMEQFEFALEVPNLQAAFFRRRGLVFQNGRRLVQVHKLPELRGQDGAYWVEPDGLTVHLRPFGDADPVAQRFEFSAREHCFAPETRYLGYVRVAGFVMEHAADAFPVPQGGALSASRGHHIILDTDGHGVYSHDSDRITVAHNLIARSTKAAVFLSLGAAKRWVQGRGATSRRHRVLSNIFTDNDTVVEFDNPDNHSDYNVLGRDGGKGPLRIHRPEQNLDLDAWREFQDCDTHSARAAVTVVHEPAARSCALTVDGALPTCPRMPEAGVDYHGQPRAEGAVLPGPFAAGGSQR